MLRKVGMILLFILTMLAGALISFLSVQVTSAEQPYQIALSRQYLNSRILELEGRVKLLETEVEKLRDEPKELSENFTAYKVKTSNELNELRKLLEDHLRFVDNAKSRMKRQKE